MAYHLFWFVRLFFNVNNFCKQLLNCLFGFIKSLATETEFFQIYLFEKLFCKLLLNSKSLLISPCILDDKRTHVIREFYNTITGKYGIPAYIYLNSNRILHFEKNTYRYPNHAVVHQENRQKVSKAWHILHVTLWPTI